MLGLLMPLQPRFGKNGGALAWPKQGAKLPGILGVILFFFLQQWC